MESGAACGAGKNISVDFPLWEYPAGSLNTIPVETVFSTVLFGAIHSDDSYGNNPNTVTDEIPLT